MRSCIDDSFRPFHSCCHAVGHGMPSPSPSPSSPAVAAVIMSTSRIRRHVRSPAAETPIMTFQISRVPSANATRTSLRSGSSRPGMAGMSVYANSCPCGSVAGRLSVRFGCVSARWERRRGAAGRDSAAASERTRPGAARGGALTGGLQSLQLRCCGRAVPQRPSHCAHCEVGVFAREALRAAGIARRLCRERSASCRPGAGFEVCCGDPQ